MRLAGIALVIALAVTTAACNGGSGVSIGLTDSAGETHWEDNCDGSYEQEIQAEIDRAWAIYSGARSRTPSTSVKYSGGWVKDSIGGNEYYKRSFTARLEKPEGILYDWPGRVYTTCVVSLGSIESAGIRN